LVRPKSKKQDNNKKKILDLGPLDFGPIAGAWGSFPIDKEIFIKYR